MLHIIDYKTPYVFYNCTKKMAEAITYMRPVCGFNVGPDWKLCIGVITFVCLTYLSTMLYECDSPRLPGAQCKYTIFVAIFIFYTYVVYYWYKLGAKGKCALPNGCGSPCWYDMPNVYAIDTLCFYRCDSPCWHCAECIYILYITSTLCCICVKYDWYKLCEKSWCVLPNGCVSPHGCGTSHGYCLSYHTN